MNIAEHVAVDLRKPVGVFSLEMSADQLGQRMLCSRARVNLRNIREGYMAERDFPKLTGSAGKINMGTLWVCDDTEQTVGQLRAKARRMRQQFNIELWIVDYLQLLTHPSARRGDTQEQEMDAIGKALKFMAREFNAPVIVISQLNDEGKLSRCRAIGHHADVLLKLRFEENADRSEPVWPMVLGIEKQRNGPTGDVRLTFIRDFTRFESAAKVSDEDYKS
jgi:replicative DNA helicase